ncbi:MAG TPA: VWA domain-containing protein [Steroidobacter sp.]|uniref:nitric oxide reductase activation protein NorD n=1 Tax=Steroidobacter sp. TaxID=1978227 RepID=UPI002ED7FD52
MPEAEDVLTDVARHATVFAQDLWRRHRKLDTPAPLDLQALLHRLDLFITAAFHTTLPLRIAQAPARRTWLRNVLRKVELPIAETAIPATDGVSIWLPRPPSNVTERGALDWMRLMAMQQAQRAQRGATRLLPSVRTPLERSIYEVLEALAADVELAYQFGGIRTRLLHWRAERLAARPSLREFPVVRQPLESWLRTEIAAPLPSVPASRSPADSLARAKSLAERLMPSNASNQTDASRLLRDEWIGELREPPGSSVPPTVSSDLGSSEAPARPPRSARLGRRPNVRQADERDEHAQQGAWMVQTAQPHEHAEDPFGLQRPTDRDETTAAEDFADAVSELTEARLVATADAPKEVLISEDPPGASAIAKTRIESAHSRFAYPEWDFRSRSYRHPGAIVHALDAPLGPVAWVTQTLEAHRAMLHTVRRQFEALHARRISLRQQTDGEDLDLEACIDAFANIRSGAALRPGLYRSTRNARREMAVLLLIDVSGSTDSWISTHRRTIDVEREALLLVCEALEGLRERYSVLAFSGEGPARVTIRRVKDFSERYSDEITQRIAGLEPERYTRAGAAIRHASALLMREAAHHRLLLILSDGKPNDLDEYDGRHGVEDTRQAVMEARQQGIFTFCLTIDRHSAGYLPAVFGRHHYAVLNRPEMLPNALLGWLRRLLHG